MYTVKQAAEMLNVSEQSIYQKLKRKKYKTQMKPHLLKKDGRTYITDEGLEILRNGEGPEPTDLTQEIEDLKQELKQTQQALIEAQHTAMQYAHIIIQLQAQRTLEIETKQRAEDAEPEGRLKKFFRKLKKAR